MLFRSVLKCKADGKGGQTIEDTGPLTKKRMETIDEEALAAAKDFIKRQKDAGQPFFCWWNGTRMHFRTHVKAEHRGISGQDEYSDGMVEHDMQVGEPTPLGIGRHSLIGVVGLERFAARRPQIDQVERGRFVRRGGRQAGGSILGGCLRAESHHQLLREIAGGFSLNQSTRARAVGGGRREADRRRQSPRQIQHNAAQRIRGARRKLHAVV